MSIFHQTFSTAQVAAAANIPHNSLQNWVRRGLLGGGEEDDDLEGGGVRGKPRLWTFRSLMTVATSQALVDLGLHDLDKIFSAARRFAMSARTNYPANADRTGGLPCHWRDGDTYLVITPDSSGVAVLTKFGAMQEALGVIGGRGNPAAFVALDVGALFRRVCNKLDLNEAAILNETYPAFSLETVSGD